MLTPINSHVRGAKYTHRKLTDCSWEIDYHTVTLEVKTHFYIEIVHFGNKKPATIEEHLLFS